MSAVFRHTMTRLRAPAVENRHGNSVRDWDDAGVEPGTDLAGWAIDAGDTAGDEAGRSGTIVNYTARRRGDTDVLSSDRLRWRGEVFEVEGDVLFQPGPSVRTSHVIVRLKRAKG
jgi:hypothetical protein